MRTYGRLLKNIAAIALLLALLSMLLPFCKFSAGGQEMTLSGLDVVKAGGRAGYTYLTEGRVADTFVLKAPITVGTVKSSLSYVPEAALQWHKLPEAASVPLPAHKKDCFLPYQP